MDGLFRGRTHLIPNQRATGIEKQGASPRFKDWKRGRAERVKNTSRVRKTLTGWVHTPYSGWSLLRENHFESKPTKKRQRTGEALAEPRGKEFAGTNSKGIRHYHDGFAQKGDRGLRKTQGNQTTNPGTTMTIRHYLLTPNNKGTRNFP